MTYYGEYNEEGFYRGFYTEEVHGDTIPENVIPLTEEEWQEALSGNYKVIDGKHTYVAPDPDAHIKIAYARLRSERDGLLSRSDWTQLADSPLTEDAKAAWASYRQALRDLPESVDIENITFPQPPI
jgi:hypothetical protein